MGECEEWRKVPSWEQYEVSNTGKVRRWQKYNKRYFTLKPSRSGRNSNQYGTVVFQDKPRLEMFYVHTLVAIVFLGECPPTYYLRQKDGDIANCNVSNLEYVSRYTDPTERWAKVKGWPYEVSDKGRVMRLSDPYYPPVVLRAHSSKVSRHMCVVFTDGKKRKTQQVHQLVAEAFIGPRPEGLVVNHIDADPTNNVWSNLEYVTRDQNNKHAAALGLTSHGEDHHFSKLVEDDIREIRLLYSSKLHSTSDLGRLFGVASSHISNIVNRKAWRHTE